ncbi:MAG: hypothetical protein P4L22_04635 [Candidatus Babeliales bacterium]|nr:hypothetical protein [Candidatus Babeliales bacterium]
MKKLLFTGLVLLSVASVSAKGHKKVCSDFSKHIHTVVGVKATGKHNEKGGLTNAEYDNCVKTGKATVTLAK